MLTVSHLGSVSAVMGSSLPSSSTGTTMGCSVANNSAISASDCFAAPWLSHHAARCALVVTSRPVAPSLALEPAAEPGIPNRHGTGRPCKSTVWSSSMGNNDAPLPLPASSSFLLRVRITQTIRAAPAAAASITLDDEDTTIFAKKKCFREKVPETKLGMETHELKGGSLILQRTRRFFVLGVSKGAALDAADKKCREVALTLPSPYTGAEVTLDQLTGSLRVFQLKRGHRFSNDDLFCAWRACHVHPEAQTCLDLGSGIGSVGLSTLAKLRNGEATLVGIEAQAVSFALASAAVRENSLEDRVKFLRGDLRQSAEILAAAVAEAKSTRGIIPCGPDLLFDLITGSPPYLPEEESRLSPCSQRAHCRSELRGSVYAYCEAAARHLKPVSGRFVFVMTAQVTWCSLS